MERKRSRITGFIMRCIIDGSCRERKQGMAKRHKKKIVLLFTFLCVGIIFLVVWLVQNPKWKYRNAAEAYETENGVILKAADGSEREYEFLAPFVNVKADRLIACFQDEDGYYREYYSIKGWDQEEYILCIHQVIMGDKYLMCAGNVQTVPYELCRTIYGEAQQSMEVAGEQYVLFSKVMLSDLELGTEKENCFSLKGYGEKEWLVQVQGEECRLYRNADVTEVPREFLYYLMQYGTGE